MDGAVGQPEDRPPTFGVVDQTATAVMIPNVLGHARHR
jgi:hypothetical protein